MNVLAWLEGGDPAVAWQVKRDLSGASKKDVGSERTRVSGEGWGARLLRLQQGDGRWGGGIYTPKWISTTYTLLLLRHLGIDPAGSGSRQAIDRLVEGPARWRSGAGFFEYSGETCVTAMVLALACYFRITGSFQDGVVESLLEQQRGDGGWNCQRDSSRSSFNTTISVLEAMLEYEGTKAAVAADTVKARKRAHEYLLERRLMRSLSTGELIKPRWRLFSFPPRWHYDVLRGLDYLSDARVAPDDRWSEALELLREKQTADGRWPLQNRHVGKEHFQMEKPGKPSRWNTLRALRVLRWVGE
jgi:hypothetical protein